MSTRSLVHFTTGDGVEDIRATLYVHSDGYPEAGVPRLYDFFDAVKAQTKGDTRFNDVSYLASKFVVHVALDHNAGRYNFSGGNMSYNEEAWKDAPLNFLGIGILPADVNTDAGQEYVYFVNCQKHDKEGYPTVTALEGEGHDRKGKKVNIKNTAIQRKPRLNAKSHM